jgi:hypothetical protein
MSLKSKTKIRPIDKHGTRSIEHEIALHERKKKMAEKFSDTKSVNFHRERIIELRRKLSSRKAATIRIAA